MELTSVQQLLNTKEKLRRLEQLYGDTQASCEDSEFVRTTTLRSIRRLINQLKEEIARFEAHYTARS